jgi:hypothetical protein
MHARDGFRIIEPLRAPYQARNVHGERSAIDQKNRGHELERHKESHFFPVRLIFTFPIPRFRNLPVFIPCKFPPRVFLANTF